MKSLQDQVQYIPRCDDHTSLIQRAGMEDGQYTFTAAFITIATWGTVHGQPSTTSYLKLLKLKIDPQIRIQNIEICLKTVFPCCSHEFLGLAKI